MSATDELLMVHAGARLTPGKLYLRLYHGRENPDQEMDDWGFNGPTFGPLSCVIITYFSTMRIHGTNPTDELWLATTQDMVQWQGRFYGDFEIFVAGTKDLATGGDHEN
jgi:hypothetical protein